MPTVHRLLCALFAFLFTFRAACSQPIRYELMVDSGGAKSFRVRITVPDPPSRLCLSIPAWTPGYYQILNYHRDIEWFIARNGEGERLPFSKPDDHTWQIEAGKARAVVAEYGVSARDPHPGFFYTYLGQDQGFINGPAAFMYVVNRKDKPISLALKLPKEWGIATPLDPGPSSGEFTASNYDDFVDCPLQLGRFESFAFHVNNIPISVVLTDAGEFPRDQLSDTLDRIVRAAAELFGGLPFRRYMFLIHFTKGSGGESGGLEHKSSTVLNVSRGMMENIRSIAPLAAHEFFHVWNIKYIRPKVLGPFDYSREVYTGSLWFAEGVTDYYAQILLHRAGMNDDDLLLGNLAGEVQTLLNTEARKRISLEEASRKAWQGGSMGYGGLSFYNKGKLVGLLFDLKIRDATEGRKSLDDVMRLLMRRYGEAPGGFEEDGILKAINEVAGRDLSAEYRSWVQGTDELPFDKLLAVAGLEFIETKQSTPFFGVTSETDIKTGLPRITGILKDTEADRSGLQEGDLIVSVNGRLMEGHTLFEEFRRKEVGEQVKLKIARSGTEVTLNGFLGGRDHTSTRLEPIPDPTPRQLAIRQAWLKGRVENPVPREIAAHALYRLCLFPPLMVISN